MFPENFAWSLAAVWRTPLWRAIELLDFVAERHLILAARHPRAGVPARFYNLCNADSIGASAVERRRNSPCARIDLIHHHFRSVERLVCNIRPRASEAVRNHRIVNRRWLVPSVAASHCSAQRIEHKPRTGDKLPV